MRHLLIIAALAAVALAANDFGPNNNPSAPRASPGIHKKNITRDATLVSKIFAVYCDMGACTPNTTIPNGIMAAAIKPRDGQTAPTNLGNGNGRPPANNGGHRPPRSSARALNVPNARITQLLFTTARQVPSFRFSRTLIRENTNSPEGVGVGFGYRILGFVEFFDAANDGLDSSDVIVRQTLFGKAGGAWSSLLITSALDSGSTQFSTYTAVTNYTTIDNGTLAELTVALDEQYSSRAGGTVRMGPDRFEHTLRLFKPYTTAGSKIAIIGVMRHKGRADDNSPSKRSAAALTDITITADADAEEPLSTGFFSWESTVLADGVSQTLLARLYGETPPNGQQPPTDGTAPAESESQVFVSFTVMSSTQANVIAWDPSTGIIADETPASSTDAMTSGLTSAQIGGIVGGVVGGVALILALLAVYFCCCRRAATPKTVSGGNTAGQRQPANATPASQASAPTKSSASGSSQSSNPYSSYA